MLSSASFDRLAVVALILGAIIVTVVGAESASAVAKSDTLVTELAFSARAERVNIFESTVEVELPKRAGTKLLKSLPIEFKRPGMLLPRSDENRSTPGRLGIVGEREIVGHILTGHIPLHIKEGGNFASGGLPAISNHDNNLVPLLVHAVSYEAQIGSQLPFGRFPSSIYQVPSSEPQAQCGKSKNDGESGNNFFAVLVNEPSCPLQSDNDMTEERATKGGIVFFALVIVGIHAMLGYAKWR